MLARKIALWYIRLGLWLLLIGLLCGTLSAFSFAKSEIFQAILPFYKLRPMHVSSVLFWILSAALGGVMYYSAEFINDKYYRLLQVQFGLWICSIIGILISYLLGYFGGREYWEYPPVLSLPILLSWLIFAYIFLDQTLKNSIAKQPVYKWMWATGVLFFVFTFAENNLWLFSWFRNNIVRDITVQWKASGAMVGAWNMLIYGAGIFLMGKISNNDKAALSKQSFFFYFLGFTNLLFNWGHHTYPVPAASWIRIVSYIISMTEWIIFLNIIREWKKTVSTAQMHKHLLPYRFILASEVWVFLNLFMALFMSIPAINIYTPSTHVTVAHAMGTTIGINTMILFASLSYLLKYEKISKPANFAFWLSNVSLSIFWLALICAGVVKGYLIVHKGNTNFQMVMQTIQPFIEIFAVSGIGVMIGLGWLAVLLLKKISIVQKHEQNQFQR
jgi:nitric oxide reductase subunit B